MITESDEAAIAAVPEDAWKPGVRQDGTIEDDKDVAEITDLMSRAGNWPEGLRWIARRVKPSRRHLKNLTAYEKKTGWKYSITCTNIPDTGIEGVPGSHHPQYVDVLHRDHATVETDGVRTAKAMGLRNLPSKTWQVNKGWVLAANIAADLTAWARTGPGKTRSSPAGSGFAPSPHPADQHQPSQRHGRRTIPARSEPARTRAPRAAAPAGPRKPNGHEDQKQAPARAGTRRGEADSLRLGGQLLTSCARP